MPSITVLIQHLGLAMRLSATAQMEPTEAFAHIEAAVAASTDEVTPELLLAVAFIESRYNPYNLSRIEGRKRVHSRWRADTPPKRLNKKGSMYCGVMQTRARSWDECLAMRDLTVAYTAGVNEITSWLRDRRVKGDISRALAGYGCGNHGVRTGKCNRYQGRVLHQTRKLEGAKPQLVQARRS